MNTNYCDGCRFWKLVDKRNHICTRFDIYRRSDRNRLCNNKYRSV